MQNKMDFYQALISFSFQLDDAFQAVLPKIPVPLQEATTRLVSKQPGPRPTAQLLQLIKYFK